MVAAFCCLPPHQPHGVVEELAGFVLAFTRSPIPTFNQILLTDESATAEGLLAAVERARELHDRWVLQLRTGLDDELAAAAHRLGLVEDPETQPAMILSDLDQVDAPSVEHLTIRRVDDDATFDDHLARGGPLMSSWLGRGVLADPAVTMYVGYVAGAPIAASMGIRDGEVIGVYNVGTQAEHRRRGIGWAMAAAAIQAGSGQGCSLATLQSSPMGFSVYAGHGFQTLYSYRAFSEPPLGV